MRKSVSPSPSPSSPPSALFVPSVVARRAGRPEGRDHRRGDPWRDGRLPADADVAYAEARKYTSNVIKVYSPNATWAKVKAAVVGASIVIYIGHGNGWPSPYTYDPQYTTKDGFGPQRDSRRRRLQQQVLRRAVHGELDLAPGAMVLLHHLCYASGNSEPGNADRPSRSPGSASTTTARASLRPGRRPSSPTGPSAMTADAPALRNPAA